MIKKAAKNAILKETKNTTSSCQSEGRIEELHGVFNGVTEEREM